MGRYFALTLAIPQEQTTKTKKKTSKQKLSGFRKFNFGVVLGMFLVMLAVVYLIQVNALSTKGYEIRQLELQVNELKEMSKRLELEAAGLQSIHSIDEDVELLNLIPSATVKHISGTDYAYNE